MPPYLASRVVIHLGTRRIHHVIGRTQLTIRIIVGSRFTSSAAPPLEKIQIISNKALTAKDFDTRITADTIHTAT